MTVFEYLVKQEEINPGFKFDRTSNNDMVVSYPGYKHMILADIVDTLIKDYGLKFDFDKELEEFDQLSNRTFTYFKNVYIKG